MSRRQHKCHGDPERFDVMAEFINERFGQTVHFIADVAGGQGLLSRVLTKRFGYESEVIDPRGWTLKGIPSRAEEFVPTMAEYYDLIVGLHPDEAIRPVVEAAVHRPIVVVPCCNFWSSEKLGRDKLVTALVDYLDAQGIRNSVETFGFTGPKNVGVVTSARG